MAKISFPTNVPVELHLNFLEGKEVESNYGGLQHMFTAREGTFYVSDTVGRILTEQLSKHRVAVGEPVEICKREVDRGNGRKGIEWHVYKVGFAPGEQPDGTFVAPAVNGNSKAGTSVTAPAPAVTATSQPPMNNGNGSKPAAPEESAQFHFGWARFLLSQTEALVDVYAAALQYASSKYGNQIKAEDIRSLMLSAFINVSKTGGANVA